MTDSNELSPEEIKILEHVRENDLKVSFSESMTVHRGTDDLFGGSIFEITVVKLRDHPDAFPICRGTPLGNPFPMRGDEALRDLVCDKYEVYFEDKLKANDPIITNELARAVEQTIEDGYIKLGCYCAPERCHGDTVALFLHRVLNIGVNVDK